MSKRFKVHKMAEPLHIFEVVRLSEMEEEILCALDGGSLSCSVIAQATPSKIAVTSVSSLLMSLRKKGLVSLTFPEPLRCKEGLLNILYTATFDSCEEYRGPIVVQPRE